jgi:opacity protein-like surface antigen
MMKNLFLLASLVILSSSYGQEVKKKDANVWIGGGLNLPITKKLDIALKTQTRFYQNATQFKLTYSQLKVKYDFGYGISINGLYRYSRVNKGSYFKNYNRFSLDGIYRYKLEMGLSFKLRLRYQHTFDRIKTINEIYPDRKNLFRYSLRMRYKNDNFKRILPFLAGELFSAISPKNTTAFWDTYRIKMGVTFDLPKRHEISVFYMFEHENRNVDNNSHIYAFQYAYTLSRLNKKKKEDKDKPSVE